jgi:hypothetical protein
MNPNLPTWWHDASIPFNYDVIIIILDCNPNPCKHGTCQSNEAGYVCICDDGYGGANCDTGMLYIYIYIYIYKSNTTGATCETGTDYPTGNPVSPLPVFSAG